MLIDLLKHTVMSVYAGDCRVSLRACFSSSCTRSAVASGSAAFSLARCAS
jgi:hypothetical protein